MTAPFQGEQQLAHVRLILVEPAGPLNVGAIARVMKNMGITQLVLVNPQCDPVGSDAQRMAVHAKAQLAEAQRVQTLPEALVGCQRIVATTARDRRLKLAAESPRQVLPWLLAAPSALIFGPEERGLSNLELSYAQRFLRIDTSEVYPSLNLAQAVALCCYELRQAGMNPTDPTDQPCPTPAAASRGTAPAAGDVGADIAPSEQIEAYYHQLEDLLLDIGYLYPHTAADRMLKLRRLFNRTGLSPQEVAMLRGILSQVSWKIQAQNTK